MSSRAKRGDLFKRLLRLRKLADPRNDTKMQKILFFGSTSDSVLVLEKLMGVEAVVTQPPRPVGREKIITVTPVEIWAKEKNITVLSFATHKEKLWMYENEQQVIDALQPIQADLIISASYGVKIPWETIQAAPYGGINVHPSLLPRWRGGDPVPWAILSGDHQIGVSVVTLSEKFDQGILLAQKKIPLSPKDTSDPLRTRLFGIGAELLTEVLKSPPGRWNSLATSNKSDAHYARRLTRDDGFEPWENFFNEKETERINRKFRAFHPWPGLWTRFHDKRLKILGFTTAPTQVQLEGKNPVSWIQFSSAYLVK